MVMSVLDLLSSSLGQKGNKANIELARQIAVSENHEAVKELVQNLKYNDKKIQGDCIKTLYETAYLKPEMIGDYYSDFLDLLTSKNNRLVWGGMIALMTITDLKSKEIFAALELIMKTVNGGSVITIDCGVEILVKLNKYSKYFDISDPLLAEQLWKCPIKQLPMYAEKSLICINHKNKDIYQSIIENRMDECEKASQTKRLEKVIRKIYNL